MTTDSRSIAISIHQAATGDGAAIHALVKACPPLDLNSRYCYLLLCQQFSRYCLMAKGEGKLAGFVSAYRHPEKGDTLFVWQIAVGKDFRGRGVAGAMLQELVRRATDDGLTYIETTVTPSNEASMALFEGLAETHKAQCQKSEYFSTELLGEGHEKEMLLRIGPLQAKEGK